MNYLENEDIGYGRVFLTILLIVLVFVIWSYLFPPPTQSEIKTDSKKETTQMDPVQIKEEPSVVNEKEVYESLSESKYVLENENLRLVFSNRGALLINAILNKYKDKNSQENDDLVSPISKIKNEYPFEVLTGDEKFDSLIKEKLFHVEQFENGITFKWSDGLNNAILKEFRIEKEGYLLNYKIKIIKNGKSLDKFFITFGPGLGKLTKEQAKNRYFQQEYVGFEKNGSFEKALRAKKVNQPFVDEVYGIGGGIKWAGIANNYFTAIFFPKEEIKQLKLRTILLDEETRKIHPAESDILLFIEANGEGKAYLGPKDYKELKKFQNLSFRMMNWGYLWFSEICYFLLFILNKLFLFTKNYGFSILLLTLMIKLAFFPLTHSSMVKMKEMGDAMKKLKPQIDKIKAKYKKQGLDLQSRAKMNEEIMALYQKEGINPFGTMSGCLPMLLQLPIFWALFTMLPNTIDLRGAHFILWIKDLSLPDPLYITPILMGISMVLSTMMTSTQQIETSQKVMLYLMPVLFTWFCLFAPSGLTLYWLANNLLTMAQQYLINKHVERKALLKQKSKKSTPKGPSKPS